MTALLRTTIVLTRRNIKLTRPSPIPDDGFTDEIEAFNKEVEELGKINNNGNPPHWFNVPWLFSECYMYR
jgi:hypothetical protein